MTENNLPAIQAGNRGLILNNMDDMVRFAEGIVRSGLAPKSFDTSAKVVIAVQSGLELGMMPMQALQGLHVINGKVGLSGDTAVALIQASGKAVVFKRFFEGDESTDEYRAVIVSKREGSEHEDRTEFSIGDARTAKLWGKAGPWTQYWKRMLMYRAIGFHSRDYFGDVTKGMVVKEELDDYPVHEAPNCKTPKREDRIPVESKTMDGDGNPAPEAGTDAGGADAGTIEVMLRGCLNKFQEKANSRDEGYIPSEELLESFNRFCKRVFISEGEHDYTNPEIFTVDMISKVNERIDSAYFHTVLDEWADTPELTEEPETPAEVDKTSENSAESNSDPADVKSFDELAEEAATEKAEEDAMTEAEVEEHSKKKFGKQWKFKCLNPKCKKPLFDEAKGTPEKPICPSCLGSEIRKAEDDTNVE